MTKPSYNRNIFTSKEAIFRSKSYWRILMLCRIRVLFIISLHGFLLNSIFSIVKINPKHNITEIIYPEIRQVMFKVKKKKKKEVNPA